MVSGTQTVNETLYTQKPYQLMRDLAPVAPLMDTDLVLVVHPVGAGEELCRSFWRWRGPNRARSISAPRGRARTTTWRPSF